MAYGDNWSIFQYCGYQAGQYGRTHRGKEIIDLIKYKSRFTWNDYSVFPGMIDFWHFQVITASEFHPKECNLFVYSSSKGTIRLCDMRQSALCDTHSKCK